MIDKHKASQVIASVNCWLKKCVGEENDILFHFVRFMLVVVLAAMAVLLVAALVVGVVKVAVIVYAAVVAALPWLILVAVAVGIVAMFYLANRSYQARMLREWQVQEALQRQAEERERLRGISIRETLLAADETTQAKVNNVLVGLRRFDHRLEVSITPAHYSDLFGDNWVNVREFTESPQGRSVPEVSALLVEIIISYRRAQQIPWTAENLGWIRNCWIEASRKLKWMSHLLETAEPMVVADMVQEPKAASIPEMQVAPVVIPRTQSSIPEMVVKPLTVLPSRKPLTESSIPEMSVTPPPAPVQTLAPQPQNVRLGPPPTLSIPPTLEELQRYHDWIGGNGTSSKELR